jgi:hypothetical protein
MSREYPIGRSLGNVEVSYDVCEVAPCLRELAYDGPQSGSNRVHLARKRVWFTPFARANAVVVLGALLGSGCGVEKLESSGAEQVPEPVWSAFEASCSCHAVSSQLPTFDRGGAFARPPLVVAGDHVASLVGQEILTGMMPPPPGFAEGREADGYAILGWIAAGAELERIESPVPDSTGSVPTTDDTGSTSDPTGTTTSISMTGEASTSDGEPFEAFLPVLEIFQGSCGGPTCHRDGGLSPPELGDETAYDNIVGVESLLHPARMPYVTPTDPTESFLMLRLQADGFSVMPPAPDPPLSQGEIDTVAAWIDAGAMR